MAGTLYYPACKLVLCGAEWQDIAFGTPPSVLSRISHTPKTSMPASVALACRSIDSLGKGYVPDGCCTACSTSRIEVTGCNSCLFLIQSYTLGKAPHPLRGPARLRTFLTSISTLPDPQSLSCTCTHFVTSRNGGGMWQSLCDVSKDPCAGESTNTLVTVCLLRVFGAERRGVLGSGWMPSTVRSDTVLAGVCFERWCKAHI